MHFEAKTIRKLLMTEPFRDSIRYLHDEDWNRKALVLTNAENLFLERSGSSNSSSGTITVL